jgi:hypothetical protein
MGNQNKIVAGFDSSYVSAFGTLETGELTPVLQGDFIYGLNTQTWNTGVVNGTGAVVDTNTGRLRIQSGTGGNGNYAYITSKKIIRYRAGQGTVARFTPVFTAGVASSIQFWGVGSVVANAIYDGFGFGYNGTAFGVFHYNAGVQTFIPQTVTATSASDSWNGYKVDGTSGSSEDPSAPFSWNPALGSPVMIKYPYLGYGDVMFYVQNPASGKWLLVHTIKYANTSAVPELSNPSLQFIGFTSSTGSVTNMLMYCASVGMFISGKRNFISNPKHAVDRTRSGVTAEVPLFILKNCNTYNGVNNKGVIRLTSISVSSNNNTNNSTSTFRLRLNPTVGGSPVFAAVEGTTVDNGVTITSGNSIASIDIAGTITNGLMLRGLAITSSGNDNIDLAEDEILLSPGDTLAITGEAVTTSILTAVLNFSEDI